MLTMLLHLDFVVRFFGESLHAEVPQAPCKSVVFCLIGFGINLHDSQSQSNIFNSIESPQRGDQKAEAADLPVGLGEIPSLHLLPPFTGGGSCPSPQSALCSLLLTHET